MATVITLRRFDQTRRRTEREYQVAFSGNYTTGGAVLDLTAALDPKFLAAGYLGGIFDLGLLQDGSIVARLNRFPGGYTGEIVVNGSATGWANAYLLKLYSAPGTELAAGAYPAAVTGDTASITVSGPTRLI